MSTADWFFFHQSQNILCIYGAIGSWSVSAVETLNHQPFALLAVFSIEPSPCHEEVWSRGAALADPPAEMSPVNAQVHQCIGTLRCRRVDTGEAFVGQG